jgi:hypothetical protein
MIYEYAARTQGLELPSSDQEGMISLNPIHQDRQKHGVITSNLSSFMA